MQKWSLVGGTWVLDYTLSDGLDMVPDTTTRIDLTDCGTTGLIGLTGEVVGDNVELFVTNSTLGDLDPTGLYGISDDLDATSLPDDEEFTELYAAGADEVIRGVSFAPVAEPATLMVLGSALAGIAAFRRRRRG